MLVLSLTYWSITREQGKESGEKSKGANIGTRGAGSYGEGGKEGRDGLGLLSGIISIPAAFGRSWHHV